MPKKRSMTHGKQEQISTLLALEQAKYEFTLLQLARPHRFAKAFNKLRENPLKAPVAIKEMYQALFPVEKPAPPGTNKEYIDSLLYPLPLNSMVNSLLYPRIKVAVIGKSLSDFGTVTHAFRAGDSNWNNLLEFGIDILAIEQSSFKEAQHGKLLKIARENGIKILVIKDSNQTLSSKLRESADLLISQTENDEFDADMPFVDITDHNPVNLSVSKGGVFSLGKMEDGVEKISISKIKSLKPNDILYLPSPMSLNFKTQKMLMEKAVSGTLVVADEVNVFEPALTPPTNTLPIKYLKSLNDDLELKSHEGVRQRREIALNFSQIKRFENLAEMLGVPFSPFRPLVSILLSSRRPEYVDQILKYISTFETRHMDIEVIFVAHGDDFNLNDIKDVLKNYGLAGEVLQRSKDTIFGDNLNFALEHANGDFVTKLDDDDLYGKNHLEDIYAAYLYSGANITGKWAHWIYFEDDDISMTWVKDRQESYVMHIPGGTVFSTKDFLKSVGGFGRVPRGIDSELYRRVRARGGVLYSTHKYNYVRVRHGIEHTYDISNEDFKTQCSPPEIKGADEKIVFA